MEDYAAKMLLKSDAALREYVTGHVQYREAAVLAALDELRRRGQPAPEEATLRPGLESAAATQRALDEAAEADRRQTVIAAADPAAEETGPSLYSPITIVLFAVLSPVIGGILMCMNLYRLGKKQATVGLAVFILAYAFLSSGLVSLAASSGLGVVWVSMALNLAAVLLYVLWVWPRYVGNTAYRSRSIIGPALVCMLLIWGLQKMTPFLIEKQPKDVRQQLEKMMPKQ